MPTLDYAQTIVITNRQELDEPGRFLKFYDTLRQFGISPVILLIYCPADINLSRCKESSFQLKKTIAAHAENKSAVYNQLIGCL